MKIKTILLVSALFSAPSIADVSSPENLTFERPQGESVMVNGQAFVKQAPQPFSLKRLFGIEAAPTLYAGELLSDASGLVSYEASGLILARTDEETAKRLAKQHGLTIVSNVGGIFVFDAPASEELLALNAALQTAGLNTQLEIFSEKMKPE
ncbi:hypothetical protein LRP49_07900 [Enterovibrio sp. ZSDZ35]|uniref:ASP external chaperone domain-containing protein n=1 Tax=Enterovibrio qingdaonensis TaxID=2899818 RepID=A0ABT5QLE2_9GAMM|nr:hypothetical protein [Enterovibrio sp. ZSDZ35]MDD1781126.1 hypothetical protein [Enterovibrio sp. ZSDZ35]